MGSPAADDLRFQAGMAVAIAGVLLVSAPVIEWVTSPAPGLHPYTLASLLMAPLVGIAAWISRRPGSDRYAYALCLAAGLAASLASAWFHPDPVPGGLLRPAAAMPLMVAAVLVPWPRAIALLALVGLITTVWPTTDDRAVGLLPQLLAQVAAGGLAVAISYGWSRARHTAQTAVLLEEKVTRGSIERDAVARFVRHASHELRTPLTPLRILPAILRKEGDDPAIRARAVDQLERQVERLTTIVDRLGTLASLESQPGPSRGDLAEQARRVAAAFPGTEVEAPPSAPSGASDVDLHAILSELVANAHEAARHRVLVRVRLGDQAWTASVEDDGPGVPESLHEILKEPFGRVLLEDHPHAGAGLGLGLVDAMAAAVGGRLDLGRSDLGGLRATVTLPLASPRAVGGPRRR